MDRVVEEVEEKIDNEISRFVSRVSGFNSHSRSSWMYHVEVKAVPGTRRSVLSGLLRRDSFLHSSVLPATDRTPFVETTGRPSSSRVQILWVWWVFLSLGGPTSPLFILFLSSYLL